MWRVKMLPSHMDINFATLNKKLFLTQGMTMRSTKVSISLPASLLEFVESYRTAHQCKSRSQVIEQALELLRSQELEAAYREAAQEVDPAWDVTIADGLSDEAW